jgi:predicted transcriptional regulator
LADGNADSIPELASQWEAVHREMKQTVADIDESHADIEAGRVSAASEAFAEVRNKMALE